MTRLPLNPFPRNIHSSTTTKPILSMKTCLYLWLFFWAISYSGAALAQKKVEQSYKVPAGGALRLDLLHATGVEVKTWDKDEILLKARVTINGGTDNDALTIKAHESADALEIRASVEHMEKVARTNKVPDGAKGVYLMGDKSVLMDVLFEVYVPARVKLTVNTLGGDVDVRYNQAALAVSSKGGDIHLRIPADASVNVALTTHGQIRSDLTIAAGDAGAPAAGEQKVLTGQINNGGTAVQLTTTDGDIYVDALER